MHLYIMPPKKFYAGNTELEKFKSKMQDETLGIDKRAKQANDMVTLLMKGSKKSPQMYAKDYSEIKTLAIEIPVYEGMSEGKPIYGMIPMLSKLPLPSSEPPHLIPEQPSPLDIREPTVTPAEPVSTVSIAE